MKLYTEQQVRKAIKVAGQLVWEDEDIVAKLTPVELPSDQEISQNAPTIPKDADDYLISNKIGFVHGAKWMKEKILNQNK